MSFRPGALGVLTGTLQSLEKKSTRAGKPWVTFSIKRGKQTINMKSFVAAVLSQLEMFVEGETISAFGKLSTSSADNGKDYTNFVALKVYDTPEEDSGIEVSGEVVRIAPNEYGSDVWIDCTSDAAYPEQVKFQVEKGVVLPFSVGEVISGAKLVPRGKYCFWTLDTGMPHQAAAPTDFNGKPIKDLAGVSYEAAPASPAAPASDLDDDIPF